MLALDARDEGLKVQTRDGLGRLRGRERGERALHARVDVRLGARVVDVLDPAGLADLPDRALDLLEQRTPLRASRAPGGETET